LKEGADAIDTITSAALDARDSDVLAVTGRVVLDVCEDFFVQVFSHVLLIAGEANPTEQVPEPRQLIPTLGSSMRKWITQVETGLSVEIEQAVPSESLLGVRCLRCCEQKKDLVKGAFRFRLYVYTGIFITRDLWIFPVPSSGMWRKRWCVLKF